MNFNLQKPYYNGKIKREAGCHSSSLQKKKPISHNISFFLIFLYSTLENIILYFITPTLCLAPFQSLQSYMSFLSQNHHEPFAFPY